MNELAMTVNDLFPSQLRGNILDIGAGTGMLYDALSRKTTIGRYVAIEPVPEIASVLHKKNDIMVLNSDINSCELPENAFDFVFVCGVDYLFKDIRAAFGKIVRTLKNGGIVAVQRNVFIDQTAYVGSPIRNFTEMFDANPLMRNWFHSEQYRSFLDQFFDITHSWRRHHHFPAEGAVAAGFVDTHIGYKTDTPKHEVLSWLETNERIVKQLGHG